MPRSATPSRVGRPDVEDRLEDRAAGDHQVGALAADAGQLAALGGDIADSRALIVAHRLGGHDQPVDRAAIILRQVEVQAGERGDRAAGAEQAQRAVADGVLARAGDALGEVGEARRTIAFIRA